MKVGILTYHDTANYGAALQAYATQSVLQSLGIDAEILDYTNAFRARIYSIRHRLWSHIRRGDIPTCLKTLLGAAIIRQRKRRFSAFYADRLKCSPRHYLGDSDLRKAIPQYDYYLVGSDQVWNEINNGGDLNYLLDFVQDKTKTLSYASSFGATDVSDERRVHYARLLASIQSISVRETTGADIIRNLTGRHPPVVLDPVFLLDKLEWTRLADPASIPKNPFILAYVTTNTFLTNFFRTTRYNINGRRIAMITSSIQVMDFFKRSANFYLATSPSTFVALAKNADLILTSSFHGTALSIIMEKQFISFLKEDSGLDSRIVDILSSLGLSDRIYRPGMTAGMVDESIDYDRVNRALALLREQSLAYLRSALNLDVAGR